MAPRSIRDRLIESRQAPGFSLPNEAVRFAVQSSRSPATCRICSSGIAGGETRVMVYYRLNGFTGKEFKNGGKAVLDRVHYHLGCVQGVLGGVPQRSWDSCHRCGKQALRRHYLHVGKEMSYGILCDACVKPPFVECMGCNAVYAMHKCEQVTQGQLSKSGISRHPLHNIGWYCQYCIDMLLIETPKALRRNEQRKLRYLQKMQKIGEEISSWVSE